VIGNIDRTNKCYRSKEDKLHSTIFYRGDPSQESAEDRELRLKTLRENRGRWVWDENKRELVRAEEYYAQHHEVEAAQVSRWDPEWSVLATGKRMSKGELKRYCKEKGKEWIS